MIMTTIPTINPPVFHKDRLDRAAASAMGSERLKIPSVSPTWLLVWQLRQAVVKPYLQWRGGMSELH